LAGVAVADDIPIAVPKGLAPGAEVKYRQGMAAREKGDLAAASAAFQEILKADSRNVAVLLAATDVAIKEGKHSDAASFLQRAASASPNDPSVYRSWARLYFTQRNFKEANTALEKAIRLAPKDPYALIDLGDLQVMGLHNLPQAVETYKRAIALDPTNSGAHYASGVALGESGKLQEAQTALRTAIRLSPSNPLPYLALGRVTAALNDAPGALEAFAGALKAKPNSVAAFLGRGDVYAALNDKGNALAEYAKALKVDPKNESAYLKTGIVHQQAGEWHDAEQAYLKAVESNSGEALAYNNLAWMAADKKTSGLDKAEMWARKALDKSPDAVTYQDTLAWVYRAKGQPDKAREILEKAAKQNPASADVNYHLGVVLQESGKSAEALTYLKKAQADKNYQQAADVQSRIAQLEKR
jgi:tetratricopeptide (TPR) repeat protein